jgi:hypothetical protein
MENGTYRARPLTATVCESKPDEQGRKSLNVAIRYAIENGPEMTKYHCVVNKEGVVMTKLIASLKEWSGWDGVDPYWFMETADLAGMEVEVVVENKPGRTDQSKLFPEIAYVNPPGGGSGRGGGDAPAPADKRAIAAKYGSLLRASAGPQPTAARPPTAKPAAPPTAPPTRQAPPLPVAKPKGATQATAWAKLNELGAGAKSQLLEEKWFGFVDATGMDQASMTPEGWVAVEAAIQEAHDAGTLTLPF